MKAFFIVVATFLFSCSSKPPAEMRIAIQPIGKFDAALVDTVKVGVEKYYGFPVTVLEPMEMPEAAFVHAKGKSPRHRADSLLKILRRMKADSFDHVIGFTAQDISVTKYSSSGGIKKPESKYTDWGVFGYGFCPGVSCVLSSFRLRHGNRKKFSERVRKVALHELGHNLGLKHCPNEHCVMQDAAETIKTIDRVDAKLCDKCKARI